MIKSEELIAMEASSKEFEKMYRLFASAFIKACKRIMEKAVSLFNSILDAYRDTKNEGKRRAAERRMWSHQVPMLCNQVASRKPVVLRARTNC